MKPASLVLLAATAATLVGGAAIAQAQKGGGLGSSKDPIDISANTTEVFQTEHRVVYRGEVEALQGPQRLRTPELTLYFAEREGAPKAATKTAGGGMGSGFGSIQRMEATGPVYLVTPTQSAKGDHGTYEATSNTITLVGNVVLQQDKNVARGDRLVIDQNSGHTTLTSTANSSSKGRVRGVFYPQDANAPAAPAR